MELTELLHLYPQTFITTEQLLTDKYLIFPLEKYFVNFFRDSLSQTERHLLETLFRQGQITLNSISPINDPWRAYLTSPGTTMPETDKLVRQISFHLEFKTTDFKISDWLTALSQILPNNYLTAYSLNESTGILIESCTSQSSSLNELDGIRQMLDEDFSTKSHMFIGNFWEPLGDLKRILQAEEQVFESEWSYFHGQTFKLQHVLFHCLYCQALPTQLVDAYYKYLLNYPEVIEIIPQLYRQQGNVSLAAKKLYLHRNTIQYRIEKFYHETRISLKQMDDLVFCYFLLTAHSNN
ncbi:helix-turn-helix domain-containing protein [Liquorilactobacillus sp.]|uniref:helix-turn-helix domain-containing protein n=1 Tax=Liquorilactobacillus sp. TaxID=2767923 RepID=UPI0039EA2CA8